MALTAIGSRCAAQSAIAFEIGKAALLGEKVFNFGELLVRRPPHPRMPAEAGSGGC